MGNLDLPKLPKWSDPGSVTAFILAILAAVYGVIRAFRPAFHAPSIVAALVPVLALLVALIALAVNIITHRKAHQSAFGALAQHSGQFVPDLEQLAGKVAPLIPKPDEQAIAQSVASILAARQALEQGAQAPSPVPAPAPATATVAPTPVTPPATATPLQQQPVTTS